MVLESEGGSRAVEDAGGGRRKASGAAETVVMTCLGDLHDPAFPGKFSGVLSGLRGLLCRGSEERLRVRKVEPWNSVRVTFTIPAQAAQRLRALAQGGDPTLARLGILSVQLQPDQVISVRVGRSGGGGGGGSSEGAAPASVRSPNVVAPPGPVLPPPAAPPPTPKSQQVFPFASMTHAAREAAQVRSPPHRRTPPSSSTAGPGHYPPPPYPGAAPQPPPASSQPGQVAGASPLLVNLLQTENAAPAPTEPRSNGEVRLKPSSEGSAFAQVRARYHPPPAYRPPQPAAAPGAASLEDEGLTSSGKRRQMLINPLTGVLEPMSSSGSSSSSSSASEEEDEGRDFPSPLRAGEEVAAPDRTPPEQQEKIKLRLKIEKGGSEAAATSASSSSVGYKVDFVKSGEAAPPPTALEEPRVPPLHISLRGRNAAVVVGSRKEKKREGKARTKTKKISEEVSGAGTGGKPPPGPSAAPLALPALPPARNNFPSEAEVVSILRSMPPTAAAHKLLDNEEKKKRESKKRLYPRERGLVAARVEEKRGRKSCPGVGGGAGHVGCSLLKSVVKSAAKEARLLSAAARSKTAAGPQAPPPASLNGRTEHYQGRDSLIRRGASPPPPPPSNAPSVLPGSRPLKTEYRPKVNCVFAPKPEAGGAKAAEALTTTTTAPKAEGGLPVTELDVSETKLKARLLGEEKEVGGGKEGAGGGGEDSGIESMDALSEKSPNQGESPSGKDDPPTAGKGKGGGEGAAEAGPGGGSSPEEVVPVRLTPALYTYSNPERAQSLREDSPSPPPTRPGAGRSGGGAQTAKSLLEQLLIEIPAEGGAERRPRSTRSSHLNNRSGPRSPDSGAGKSSAGDDPPPVRSVKRRCGSEGGGGGEATEAAAAPQVKTELLPSPADSTASNSSAGRNRSKQSESSEEEAAGGAAPRSAAPRSKEEESRRGSVAARRGGARRSVRRPSRSPPPRESQRRKTRSLASAPSPPPLHPLTHNSDDPSERKRRRTSRDGK